ncbi:MAG: ABC transporter ATP-binding protein [Deltaproteobacteria bacterium]|nr:ABC transporter ATP-binding protein [Deltaproteobacteria bacterium]
MKKWLLRLGFDPRMSTLIAPVRTHLMMGITALAMSSFLMVVDPLLGKGIIDEGIGHKNTALLWNLLIMMALLTILSLALESVGLFFVQMCLDKIRIVLQQGVARSQLTSQSGKKPLSAGEYQQLSMSVVHDASVFLTSLPARATRSVVQLIWIGFIVTALSPLVGLATIGATAILAFFSLRLSDKIATVNSGFVKCLGGLGGRLQQIFAARNLIRQYHRTDESMESLTRSQEQSRDQFTLLFSWETAYVSQEVIWSMTFTIAVIAITGLAVVNGSLTLGQYIAISIYAARIQGPIRQLLSFYKEALKGLRQFRYVMEVIGETDTKKSAGAEQFSWGGAIEFENVSHGGLVDASLRIKRGERLLFAGEDPGPLSHVLELISGATKPAQGGIKVGGHALSDMPLQYRRRWAALVSADPQLIPGTLLENICFGTKASLEEVSAVVTATGLRGFVDEKGLEMPVDPSVTWSASLKHRIQIARTLLFKPEIILVEDFSGSLDADTTSVIFRALTAYGKTIIAAGFRDNLLELADRVVWVEQGRCGEAELVDRFLVGPRAALLVPQGHLQLALQGKGALSHAQRWAMRNSVEIKTFSIELFGDERRSLDELPGVASGKLRLRCVFMGKVGQTRLAEHEQLLERRLVKCVNARLTERKASGVFFTVEPEGELVASERLAA